MEKGNKKLSATQVVKENKKRIRRKYTAEETRKNLEKELESKKNPERKTKKLYHQKTGIDL